LPNMLAEPMSGRHQLVGPLTRASLLAAI
jgi:hypothetical protein